MRKLFRPASLLFYLLAAIVCFAAGIYYALFTGMGDGQNLSDAIILWHGIISGSVALMVSFVIVYYSSKESIGRANRILLLLFLLLSAFTAYRLYQGQSVLTAVDFWGMILDNGT
jgi:hypothetical protein